MKTINITPTWVEILPVILLLLSDANETGKQTAREELLRMAKAADLYNKSKADGKREN